MIYRRGDFLNAVVAGGRLIYCASALFSPLSRIGGLHLAQAVEKRIGSALSDHKDDPSRYVFLPFRDNNQGSIQGANRARRIYELDVEQLERSAALLARIDGLAKDSGVLMELGYACGRDLATGVLLTDFMWEGATERDLEWHFDPVLTQLVDVCELHPILASNAHTYEEANLYQELSAVEHFVELCFERFERQVPKLSSTAEAGATVYIDFMGGRYNWAEEEQKELQRTLEMQGIRAAVAERYTDVSDLERIRENARSDIEKALRCRIALFSGDAPEMDPGAAVLFGLCKAQGRSTVVLYSSPICYCGAGGQKMRLNLMIEQAANRVVTTPEAVVEAVLHLID